MEKVRLSGLTFSFYLKKHPMSTNDYLQKEINEEIKEKKRLSGWFQKIASYITRATGSAIAFILAVIVILIWAVTGPLFNFSDTWQLVINTGTTIITFLMVFIIQQTQNKDSMAMQLKLNELIACDKRASNRLIVVEELTQEELEILKKFYVKLAALAKEENLLHSSHSVDGADTIHAFKVHAARKRSKESKEAEEN